MESHNLVVLALLLAAVGFVGFQTGAVAFTEQPAAQYHSDRDVALVEMDDNTALWPYTSRERAFHTRTLGINVIVRGDTEDVRQALLTRTDADWNETTEDWEDLDPETESVQAERNGTAIEWESARGATRYTYVALDATDDDEPIGYWMASTAQFHDGEYMGTRQHVRLYEPLDPERGWVAMQAHQEHWDWFGLRHSVDSNERAQRYVEEDFMDQWFVEDVSREYYGTSDALDTDGWVTVIELRSAGPPGDTEPTLDPSGGSLAASTAPAGAPVVAPWAIVPGDPFSAASWLLAAVAALPVAGAILSTGHASRTLDRTREQLAALFETIDLRYLVLFGATVSVLLFVRAAGITLEQNLSGATPRLIVVLCHPLLAFGTPLCAALPARSLDELQSFLVASSGIALGIMLDYSLLGVGVLPVDILVHRLGVVLAVGLIAAGTAETTSPEDAWNTTLRLGVLLWAVVVLAPLVQWF